MRKATISSAGLGLLVLFLVAGCGGGSTGSTLTLTEVDPPEGVHLGGTPVALTGTGFSGLVDVVTFGRKEATDVRYVNDTTVTCVTPSGSPRPCDVGIVTAKQSVALEACFAYLPPEPILTAVSPDEGLPGIATRITLTGSQLHYEPVTVTVDGQPCGSVSVTSDSSLTCTVPTLRSGQDLTVAVTTAGGTASLPAAFSYLVYPYRRTYFFVEFNGLTLDNDPGLVPTRIPAARARWGTLTTDGGGIRPGGEIWSNDQGAVTGPTTAPTAPHHVGDDRRFTWGSITHPDLVGRITADGSLGILGSVRVGRQHRYGPVGG